MKAATRDELERFLESLTSQYDVRAPIALHDGTRALGRLDEGPLSLEGGRVPRKPTSVFFPQFDEMLTIAGGNETIAPPPPEQRLLVVGFTAEDLACLEFVDKFFSTSYRDEVYFRKRAGSVVVGVSGRCGADGAFMAIAGGKCDLELICDGERYLAAGYTAEGAALEAALECAVQDAALAPLQAESEALPTEEQDVLLKASELIVAGAVPDAFWAEISDRCIACTGCNLACPTCTCFDVQDWKRGDRVERSRLWDSCQLDGFMREASGHNPMGTEGLRTRRRIHHRLAADLERWGHVTCFLCGRCDDVCPTNIGIKRITEEIVARYGSAA